MAGIGEASAIIAVAQAGISLSMVIIAYVGEVKDAPKSISRIGNEIKSTSGRLEEIAEIIRDNPITRLLLDTAVGDATRYSSECELILAQVGNLLVKGGWKRGSTGLSKDDIDTSVVASLKWPFLKTRLDTPRVELQRIKADLILLFNVAMARKSSTPLTNEYARKIPFLTKKKEEAARRAEEARQKARESQDHDYGTRTVAEEDPELSQQFLEFELQRAKEQEDRRIQERAALLQAENDKKRISEEDRQQEIARKAIEDYKLQQEELRARTAAREKQLSDELLALGLRPEQVASVLAVPSLNVDNLRSNAISQRKSTESQRTSLNDVARKPKSQEKKRSGFAINFLPWRGVHKSRSYDSESNSVGSNSQRNGIYQYNRRTDDEESIELWLVDVFSRQHTQLAPSERWMSQKLIRIEKSNDVWHRFAQLQPIWRVGIQDFLNARNEAQTPFNAWKLIHIGLPRRMMKISFFGHNHQGQLVRLIISRRNTANQGVNSVFVVKSAEERTSQSTVRARTYLPRQLVSTSAIRECSYDYEENFDVPSDDTVSELRGVTDKTHIMIPEALTLKQVNTLASLTKSYMENGREPWAAQPLFTYTVIENEIPHDDQERVYGHTSYGPGQAPGGHTPAHRTFDNQQRDLGPYEFIDESRKLGEWPPPPQPSPQWLRESHRRRSADSGGANKMSFEPRRATPGKYDEITPQKINTKTSWDVMLEDPIQRDEKRVVFKDQQRPSHYTGYNENNYGRETDGPERIPEPEPSIELRRERIPEPEPYVERREFRIEREREAEHEHRRHETEHERRRHEAEHERRRHEAVDLTRPTYIKVHRKYLSPETLDAYELPWEWMEGDPDYVLIKQWIPEPDQDILFEHTRKLREEKLFADIKRTRRHYTEKSEIEKPKKGMSFERKDTWPDGRNSQALVLRKPRERFSPPEYPSRKSTYDDGIRVRGYNGSRSPSPDFDPYDAAKRKLSLAPPLSPPTLSKSFASRDQPWHKYDTFSSRTPKPFLSSRVATQSRAQASTSVESSDDDEDDHVIFRRAKDGDDYDANLIAKTLSRYTTFKVDEDVTAGAKSSPHAADAPMYSSTPPHYPSTLEDMKSSLEKMQIKQSRAEEEGDLATTSDLQYYAIPEMQRRIREKEDEARTRAEAAEDEVASVSNYSKKTRKAVPISPVQWRGILDDSPTKEPNDRRDQRTSHVLKKRKSTDDLRNEDLADPSTHPTATANHVEEEPVAQNTRKQKTKQNNSSTERLDNDTRHSTGQIILRRNRSPSQSESEREPVRRADTQLYEADSEGSGGEVGTYERRNTWRRPTVEDEGVVEDQYEIVVEEEVEDQYEIVVEEEVD